MLNEWRGWTRGWFVAAVLTVCCVPVWWMLGSHPLYNDSEGRYAAVAWRMVAPAERQDVDAAFSRLLVPVYAREIPFKDRPHLTKPPMTYWLMAGSMQAFGKHAWSARLPSAVAATLTILMVFLIGRACHGTRAGLMSAMALSVMPAFVVVGRLALTDALLCMCVTGAVGCGLMGVKTHAVDMKLLEYRYPRGGWWWGMWGFVAMGLLVKGPIAWLGVGLLVVWLLLTARWAVLRHMGWWGLVVSTLPLGGWVALVAWQFPGVWSLWWVEIVDRATGAGDHVRPWWWLLPVFVLGLVPATMVMPMRWRQWRLPGDRLFVGTSNGKTAARHETLVCDPWGWVQWLWLLWMIVPAALFTLFAGKLMTYVAPGCAGGALLAGWVLDRGCRALEEGRGERWPGLLGTLTLSGVLLCGGVGWGWWSGWLPGWFVVVLCGVCGGWVGLWWWKKSGRGPQAPRAPGAWVALVGVWVLGVLLWVMVWVLESGLTHRHSTPAVVEEVKRLTGFDRPGVLTVGYEDASLAFYTERWTGRVDPRFTVQEWAAIDRAQLVLLAEPAQWDAFASSMPALLEARYERVGEVVYDWREGKVLRVYAARGE